MASKNQASFPVSENVDCPNCHKSITLYDPEGSEFCVCSSCNSFIRFTSDTDSVLQQAVQHVKAKPIIPLGTEGTLKGHKFKVIAYLEKKEEETSYTWEEYLLYNPAKGYVTLAVYNGHWNYIVGKDWEPTLDQAYSYSSGATYNGIDYQLFNKYTPVTTALIGEFDWDVLKDNLKTREYIAPPFLISEETKSNKKAQYYLGEYTEPSEIAEAFGLDVDAFPTREGIGANQPSQYAGNANALGKYALLAILSMLLLYLSIKFVKPERELINSDYNIVVNETPLRADSAAAFIVGQGTFEFKPFMTSSFEQTDGNVPLEIVISSNIDNTWLENTVIMVNEKTNETREITKGTEYYHGYEGGESWREGSKSTSIILTRIPEGKYHLNIYPASGDRSQSSLHIRITSGITLWRNIVLVILALGLYPAYCWFRMLNFERRRWMNSDFTPYPSE